jgi:hypothetical protein
MASKLDYIFGFALALDRSLAESEAHKSFYIKLARDVRGLASTLGLPTEALEIESLFPLTGAGPQVEDATNVPDGLALLLKAASDALFFSKGFSSVIAKYLKDRDDFGDWIDPSSIFGSREETIVARWASIARSPIKKTMAEINSAIAIERTAFEAELTKNKIFISDVPPDVQLDALIHMANYKTPPLDALEFAVLRAEGFDDPIYGLRMQRREEFCKAQLLSLPFILAPALGATEQALRKIVENRQKYENSARRFLQHLFYGLDSIHYEFFNRHPETRDSDNLPEGSGVIWTQGILRTAAANIETALQELNRDPLGLRAEAIRLVKYAASLSPATIADRLEAARKS